MPQTKDVRFGVSCSDALSMADACAVSAIAAGADEIKTAAYCVDTANLAHLAKLLAAKAQEPHPLAGDVDVSDGPQPALAV